MPPLSPTLANIRPPGFRILVWDALFPPERRRVLQLLIERVDYDAVKGCVALTFRPTGIRTLAAEAAE